MITTHDIQTLHDETRYVLLRKLLFSEIPEFVFIYIKKKNIITGVFFFLFFLFLLFSILFSVKIFSASAFSWKLILYAVYGLVLFPVLLIPVHEGIHAMVYFFAGAKKITIGAEWRQFFFYITAGRYPVGRRKFFWIAIAPFLLISTGLFAATLISGSFLSWSLYLTLFVHATMCIGDFAMLSFYCEHAGKEIITYDDIQKKTAYFFIRKTS